MYLPPWSSTVCQIVKQDAAKVTQPYCNKVLYNYVSETTNIRFVFAGSFSNLSSVHPPFPADLCPSLKSRPRCRSGASYSLFIYPIWYISSFIPNFIPIFNRPFHSRSSLQTRPTTTPTTNLRSKPNLPRCSGPPSFFPQARIAHSAPLFPQATTAMDPRVLDAMMPFFTDMYGNPHSRTHAYGWEAEHAVDEARRVSGPFLGTLSRA